MLSMNMNLTSRLASIAAAKNLQNVLASMAVHPIFKIRALAMQSTYSNLANTVKN